MRIKIYSFFLTASLIMVSPWLFIFLWRWHIGWKKKRMREFRTLFLSFRLLVGLFLKIFLSWSRLLTRERWRQSPAPSSQPEQGQIVNLLTLSMSCWSLCTTELRSSNWFFRQVFLSSFFHFNTWFLLILNFSRC